MQVADFLLGDWSLGVNWVKPGVFDSSDLVLLEVKARSCEGCLVLDIFKSFYEICPLGQDVSVSTAEISDVVIKALFVIGSDCGVTWWSDKIGKLLLDEETSVEASWDFDTI